MVLGRDEPERDGVADYARHLSDVLGEVARVPWRGLLATARRVRALRPDVVHVQFAPSAFGFSARPGLLPDLLDVPLVTTLHEYGWWSKPAWLPGSVWRAVERRGWWDRETGRLAPASAAVVVTNGGHAR